MQGILRSLLAVSIIMCAYASSAQTVSYSNRDIAAFRQRCGDIKPTDSGVVYFTGSDESSPEYYWAEYYTPDAATLERVRAAASGGDAAQYDVTGWVYLYRIARHNSYYLLQAPLAYRDDIDAAARNKYLRVLLDTIPPGAIEFVNHPFQLDLGFFKPNPKTTFSVNGIPLARYKHSPEPVDSLIIVDMDRDVDIFRCRKCDLMLNIHSETYDPHKPDRKLKLAEIDSSLVENLYITSAHIPGSIHISNSAITTAFIDSATFDGAFSLDSCAIPGGMEIFNAIFRKDFDLAETWADRNLTATIDPDIHRIGGNVFYGRCRLNTNAFVAMDHNKFMGGFTDLSREDADTAKIFAFTDFSSEFYGSDSISASLLFYAAFDKSIFNDSLIIITREPDDFSVAVDTTVWKRNKRSMLEKAFFKEGTKVFFDPENTLSFYKINLYSLGNIDIRLMVSSGCDTSWRGCMLRRHFLWLHSDLTSTGNAENAYYSSLNFLDRLRSYAANYNTSDKAQKDEVIERIEYWKRLAGMDDQVAQGGWKWFGWAGDEVLKHTVNFGYRGVWHFLLWSLALIVVFGLLFFASGSQKVANYMLLDGNITRDFEVKENPEIKNLGSVARRTISGGRSLLQCIWLSAFIYINPKFPNKYFHIKGWLFLSIVLCWISGMLMLTFFLMFIAAKAGFLRAVLAL